jgi:hypothetical protein
MQKEQNYVQSCFMPFISRGFSQISNVTSEFSVASAIKTTTTTPGVMPNPLHLCYLQNLF